MKEIKDGLRLVRPERKVVKYDPSMYQGQYTGTLRYGCGEGDRHEQLVKMLISIRLLVSEMSFSRLYNSN